MFVYKKSFQICVTMISGESSHVLTWVKQGGLNCKEYSCYLPYLRQENLWLALVTWSTEQQDQAHQVQELSKHIIFNLMEESFIREQVLKSSIYRFLDKDWASELLFLFGGDFSESRRIVSYNSDTDR